MPQVDATPTDGSSNAVSSNGVVDYVEKVNNIWNIKGRYLIPYLANGVPQNTAFSSNASNSNNHVKWILIEPTKKINIKNLAITQAGTTNDGVNATITMYIYDNTNDGLPGNRLYYQESPIGIFTTTGKLTIFSDIDTELERGSYWIGLHIRNLNTSGTNPTIYFVPSYVNGIVNTLTLTNNYNGVLVSTSQASLMSNNPTIGTSQNTTILYPLIQIELQ